MDHTKSIVFVTGNPNKLNEVRAILQADKPNASARVLIESRDLNLPEIQGTTREVALAKIKAAVELVKGPCITEDTALCFEAMNGLPGPYIKWFLGDLGHEGINTMLSGFPNKEAYALCTLSYCDGPGHEPVLFEGMVQGTIVAARGSSNFGWDPIFEVKGTSFTFAEMSKEEKNSMSHRFKALRKLQTFLWDN